MILDTLERERLRAVFKREPEQKALPVKISDNIFTAVQAIEVIAFGTVPDALPKRVGRCGMINPLQQGALKNACATLVVVFSPTIQSTSVPLVALILDIS